MILNCKKMKKKTMFPFLSTSLNYMLVCDIKLLPKYMELCGTNVKKCEQVHGV